VGGEVVVVADVVDVVDAGVVAATVVTGTGVVVAVVVVTGAAAVDDELQLAMVKQAANMTGRRRRETMAWRIGLNL
jgi:hypothetical protein